MVANTHEAIRKVAAAFGGTAEETILNENWFKHVSEIDLIRSSVSDSDAVIDVGGGLGVNLLCLRALGHAGRLLLIDRFTEYDVSNRMGTYHQVRPLLANDDIEILETDFWPNLQVPVLDQSFDLATSFDVIEHLPGRPLQHLSEIARVLKIGSRIVLGAPNAVSLMKRVGVAVLGKQPYAPFDEWMSDQYFGHFREYTAAEYRVLLERSGFRVVRQDMSAAVTNARAKNRYHNRKHSWASPTTYALYGIAAIEAVLPSLRHSVFTVGERTRGNPT